jgi:hypothetical protein
MGWSSTNLGDEGGLGWSSSSSSTNIGDEGGLGWASEQQQHATKLGWAGLKSSSSSGTNLGESWRLLANLGDEAGLG